MQRFAGARDQQVETHRCSHESVMRHPNFSRGFADIRAGRPFNPDVIDNYWAYERGRLLGAIAPLSLKLFDDEGLNPIAVKLFAAAVERKLIP